jgi:hypothetical protein
LTALVDENELERFLEPLLAEWNVLAPDELRSLRDAPLAIPKARVTYLGEERSPFGYEYVTLEIRCDPAFKIRVQIEGAPGDLSMKTYLPIAHVIGDPAACARWLRRARRA